MGLIADMLLELQQKQTNQINSEGATSPFASRYYFVSPGMERHPISKYGYDLCCGKIFKDADKS